MMFQALISTLWPSFSVEYLPPSEQHAESLIISFSGSTSWGPDIGSFDRAMALAQPQLLFRIRRLRL